MAQVSIKIVRQIDNRRVMYVRQCDEVELDGLIGEEQLLPGTILTLDVSRVRSASRGGRH